MGNRGASPELLTLLNKAVARELKVTIQYMFQHTIESGKEPAPSEKTLAGRQSKFVGTHWPIFLWGSSLRKVAITEMRHAEAVAERVVHLGGQPTTQPDAVTIGGTAAEMLGTDRDAERGAIELYKRITEAARKEHDDVTADLFKRILSEEEDHYRQFSELLGEE